MVDNNNMLRELEQVASKLRDLLPNEVGGWPAGEHPITLIYQDSPSTVKVSGALMLLYDAIEKLEEEIEDENYDF